MSTKFPGKWFCDKMQEGILLFHLGQMNRALFKRANRFLTHSGYPVRAEQIPVLMALYMKGGQSQQELAEEVGRDKASVLRTVRFLTKHGYVEANDDPSDGRKRKIELTGSGTCLLEQMLEIVVRVDRILFSAIGENDKKKLIGIMGKITNRLRDDK